MNCSAVTRSSRARVARGPRTSRSVFQAECLNTSSGSTIETLEIDAILVDVRYVAVPAVGYAVSGMLPNGPARCVCPARQSGGSVVRGPLRLFPPLSLQHHAQVR